MVTFNKAANLALVLAIITGVYFAVTFAPPYVDNYQLKNAARAYISGSRDEKQQEHARKLFMVQARDIGIKLDESNVDFERMPGGTRAKVSVEYTRNAEYPFSSKVKRLKFKWTVIMKYRTF